MTPCSIRRTCKAAFAVVCALGLAVTGCSASGVIEGSGKVITVSLPTSDKHALAAVMEGWADEVEEATGGELTFEFNYSSSLCPPADGVGCVGSGRADAGQTSPAWEPSKFPLTTVVETGFVGSDVAGMTKAMNAIAEETPQIQEEYASQNQKLLFFATTNPLVVATPQRLESLEDMSGISMDTPGAWPRIVEPLGVAPVTMAHGEQYESLQRGVIGGVITSLDSALDLSLPEITPYFFTIGEHVGLNIVASFTMNKDVYDGLTGNQRAAVDAASQNAIDSWYSDYLEPQSHGVCERLDEAQAVVYNVGTEESAAPWLDTASKAVENNWKSAASAHIDDPDALLTRFRELARENTDGEPSGPVNGVQVCMQ